VSLLQVKISVFYIVQPSPEQEQNSQQRYKIFTPGTDMYLLLIPNTLKNIDN
jgi:hypothetical protein